MTELTDIDFNHLVLLPNEIDLVIYHGPCGDGFGSALSSYMYFKDSNGLNSIGKKVEYLSASHGKLPPLLKTLYFLILKK